MRPENPSPSEREKNDRGQAEILQSAPSERETAESVSKRGDFLADHRASRPEPKRRVVGHVEKRVVAFAWIGIFMMLLYGIFTILSAMNPGYRPIDYVGTFMLLFGVGFILLHGLGYANQVIKASAGYDETRRRTFTPTMAPKVLCVIASYNESPEMLEESVAALVAMDYPNKQIVLLDDSTNEDSRRGAREVGAEYGLEVVQRSNRRGYKAGAINDFLPKTDAQYLAVFDADALPAHNFLRDILPVIDENPRLAYVQTPQYYSNTRVSNVAMAASGQQVVFYEYICEGKSISNAMFCCGTNIVLRIALLQEAGGFAEDSVSEDMAAGLNMHLLGYESLYYNQVYVYGLAPENLSSYFTQQSRWALGSVGLMNKVIRSAFAGVGRMKAGQWWEYFLATSYYWIGWVNFFFMLLPLMYIFFNIKPLRQDTFTYIAIFIPYMVFTMNMFYSGMEARGHKMSQMIMGQQLGFLCFPIHMVSAVSGLIGLKRPFATTPKGYGGRLSWLSLWPQLLMLVISAVAFVWAIYEYAMGLRRNDGAILINAMWAFYHVFLLSGVFTLNKAPFRREEYQRHFEEDSGRGVPSRVISADEMKGQTAAAGTGAGLFVPVEDSRTGRVSTPARRVVAPPVKAGGRWALVLFLLSLLLIGATGWSLISWYLAPKQPVNVYIADRTTGRDYQEHRALSWTLNYLKLNKQANFGPEGRSTGGGYDFAKDFYGFIPGTTENKEVDETRQADFIVHGKQRELPAKLNAPGVIYLADTYGEFVEYDYALEKYVRYVSEPRGILPAEVDRIEDFSNRGGLLIGEWNTIGYPTLPSQNSFDRAGLQTGINNVKKGLVFYRTVELPRRQRELKSAQQRGDANAISTFEQQMNDTNERIKRSERDLVDLNALLENAAGMQAQLAAQQKLEKLLKADYRGWYGRYVDRFEDEREYDFRMWKNVQDYLRKKYPDDQSKWEPRGPGFVFYKDGPSRIFDPETKQLQPNPFSEPIVILGDELGDGPTNQYAEIFKNSKAASDPLLKKVPESMACRFWFDVVAPLPGAKVLAYYKLQLKSSAADRLRKAGFPAGFLFKREGDRVEVVMPATIAGYGAVSKANNGGQVLRSLYFAGDASDYQLVSRIAQMVPATGGVLGALGKRAGSFSTQHYWNYYEPILREALTNQKNIQYTK